MIKLLTFVLLVIVLAPAGALAQSGHEYSPLEEKAVGYKNWVLKDLKDDKPVDLRSLLQGKKLVMVVYFAPGAATGSMRLRWPRSYMRSTRPMGSK